MARKFVFQITKQIDAKAVVEITAESVVDAARILDERSRLNILKWEPILPKGGIPGHQLNIGSVYEENDSFKVPYAKYKCHVLRVNGHYHDEVMIWAQNPGAASSMVTDMINKMYPGQGLKVGRIEQVK